jgi:site-specific DNA-methyltransferase (adenine-specific)
VPCTRKIGPFDCCSVVQGDCFELIRRIPKGGVSAVITDPPYSFHARGGGFHKSDNPKYQGGRTYLSELQKLNCTDFDVDSFCAITPSPYIIACSNKALLLRYLGYAESAELLSDVHVWVKPNPIPAKSTHFLHDLEYIVVMRPRGSYFDGSGQFDDYRKAFTQPANDSGLHPAEKPLALMEKYVRVCTPEGAVILDPFCGSGTTLVAASRHGRHFLGFDIESKYVNVARERLARVEAQPNLFTAKPEQLALEHVL